MNRRAFLTALPVMLALAPERIRALRVQVVHPDPRPGITGTKVVVAAKLEGLDTLVPLFDGIRAFAAIADGIGCYCGCADDPNYRSLLTCYEDGTAMALHCEICQGQGRLVVRRAREGQTLAQIRRAVDARYGSGRVSARGSGRVRVAQHDHRGGARS